MRSLKDRVAELKNQINSQFPGNSVVELKLHELDTAIAELENPTAKPVTGAPLGISAAGFPKVFTAAGKSDLIVDNVAEEKSALAQGYTPKA